MARRCQGRILINQYCIATKCTRFARWLKDTVYGNRSVVRTARTYAFVFESNSVEESHLTAWNTRTYMF